MRFRGVRWRRAFLVPGILALLAAGAAAGQARGPSIPRQEFLPHPDDADKRVEWVWSRPEGDGPWPVLLLIHGHQEGDRPGAGVYLSGDRLQELATQGFVAAAVSQPGYGKSDGPPDYCGPRTQAAVAAVIDRLKSLPFVAADRIGLYGYSRGAIVASMVAARRSDLAAVILGAGIYDLGDAVQKLDRTKAHLDGMARNVERETGGTPEAYRARSALPAADRIRAATLILHGALDDRAPVGGARQLAAALEKAGTPVTIVVYPEAGHGLPFAERETAIQPFLARWLLRR